MHFVDGLPVKREAAPNIFDDLAMLRRLEQEPGPLQPLQERDVKSARNRLGEYRTIVTSPLTGDEARDRAMDDSDSLRSVMEDLIEIRLIKITALACHALSCCAEVSTNNMTQAEQELYQDLLARITEYYSANGFGMTKDGMRFTAPAQVKV